MIDQTSRGDNMKKEQYIALKTKLSFKTNREISFKSMVESRREGRVLPYLHHGQDDT